MSTAIRTLICPGPRPEVAALAKRMPLALIPILGRPLLSRHMAALFESGQTDVTVVGPDRPVAVRETLQDGQPWGIKAVLIPKPTEPAPAEGEVLMDRAPNGPPAFASYEAWFRAVQTEFARGSHGEPCMREIAPGLWIDTRARVSSSAHITPPAWIGEHVHIGPDAEIGPNAFIEKHCAVESGVTVRDTWIGPGTFVGPFTELTESLAWGKLLCKWTTGDTTEVADSFLLGELTPAKLSRSAPIIPRVLALLAIVATWPIAIWAALSSLLLKQPFTSARDAVLPDGGTCRFLEFSALPAFWRRWPRLWNIATGTFSWFGNPPLTPDEKAMLEDDFEASWCQTLPGLVSLSDAMGAGESVTEEGKAHAGFYSACPTWRLKLRILSLTIPMALRQVFPTRSRIS